MGWILFFVVVVVFLVRYVFFVYLLLEVRIFRRGGDWFSVGRDSGGFGFRL